MSSFQASSTLGGKLGNRTSTCLIYRLLRAGERPGQAKGASDLTDATVVQEESPRSTFAEKFPLPADESRRQFALDVQLPLAVCAELPPPVLDSLPEYWNNSAAVGVFGPLRSSFKLSPNLNKPHISSECKWLRMAFRRRLLLIVNANARTETSFLLAVGARGGRMGRAPRRQ